VINLNFITFIHLDLQYKFYTFALLQIGNFNHFDCCNNQTKTKSNQRCIAMDNNQESIMMNVRKHWYAIYTMPRTEKKVEARMKSRDMEVYLPLIPTIRVWSDRKKKIEIPLIPGFVFVRNTPEAIFEAMDVEGALGIIRYMGKPAKIRDVEMNNIRILLKEPDFINVLDQSIDLTDGDDVEVVNGPFIGLIGKCIRMQGKFRMVIEVEALKSVIEVNVPLAFLQPSLHKDKHLHKQAACMGAA
jgi:transcription antitermination factor NusG